MAYIFLLEKQNSKTEKFIWKQALKDVTLFGSLRMRVSLSFTVPTWSKTQKNNFLPLPHLCALVPPPLELTLH